MKKPKGACLVSRNAWIIGVSLLLMLFLQPLHCIATTAEATAPRPPQNTSCLKEVCVEPVKTIAGQKIPLTGLQLFTYWGFELYTAALYLPQGTHSIEGALSDVPKSLFLIYRRKIRNDQIIKAGSHNLEKNPSNNVLALQERLDRLNAAYRSVQKNDRYELLYEPGRGTTLLFNDKPLVTLPGVDFQKAYFGIWLSDYPLNAKLRDGLLGGAEQK